LNQLFIAPDELIKELDNCRIVELGNKSLFEDEIHLQTFSLQTINYNQTPQPSFGRNFDLLIQDLQQHQKAHFQSFLFAENSRQIERFQHIFNDKKSRRQIQSLLHRFSTRFYR
jgi:transcription-repair coupling factor (superfamily II helicase)